MTYTATLPTNTPMSDIWDGASRLAFTNEASVEHLLVEPLLAALGYEKQDIAPKHPIRFFTGRQGRPHEADYAVFNGAEHNRDTSLLVVEVKKPTENLGEGKEQAESYGQWLRAPVYMLTNGVVLEVWQLQRTSESNRLLQFRIADLAQRRGELERVLAKRAVIDHCKTLEIKKIPVAKLDFSDYEARELERASSSLQAAERTLAAVEGAEESLSDSTLLSLDRGAVVLAPSGYGKTTLAAALVYKALAQRWANPTSRLAVDAPLWEVAALKRDVKQYVFDRLKPYRPALSEAALEDILCQQGIVLVCDGFERLTEDSRTAVIAQLNVLCRDYPLAQVFVFSRPNAAPRLPLPSYRLDELSAVQQRQVAQCYGETHDRDTRFFVDTLPPFLLGLSSHPLLLSLMLDYWGRERQLPRHLPDLFDGWLKHILEGDGMATSVVARRQKVLFALADLTVDSAVDRAAAVDRLVSIGLQESVIDELIDRGALSIKGPQVELAHEALADYVRALQMTKASNEDLERQLDAIPLRTGSLFAILLMSLLRTRGLQARLWARFTTLPIQDYLYSLRFSADVSDEFQALGVERGKAAYAEDLTAGVDALLTHYCPQLRQQVIHTLTLGQASAIRVHCAASNDFSSIAYGYAVPDSAVDDASAAPYFTRSRNLRLSRMRTDNARLIASIDTAKAVTEAVKNRALNGGPAWTAEVVVSRLRGLQQGTSTDMTAMPLRELRELLETSENQELHPSNSRRSISVVDLIAHIDTLIVHGLKKFDLWWKDGIGHRNIDDTTIAKLLDEHFRRSQIAYREVVEESFQAVRLELRHYPMLPLRWSLTIVNDPEFPNRRSMHYHFRPVKEWVEAGADVQFSGRPPPRIDSRRHWEENGARLRAYGRKVGTSHGVYGMRQLPSFSGHSSRGYEGETSVVSEVCNMLEEDLKTIFEPLRQVDPFI